MPISPMAQSATMAGTKPMQMSSVEAMHKMFLESTQETSVSCNPQPEGPLCIMILILNFIFLAATPVGGSVYGYSNTGIVLEDVMCTSFESLIDVCSRSPFYNFTQPQCQYEATNSAGVICTIPGSCVLSSSRQI